MSRFRDHVNLRVSDASLVPIDGGWLDYRIIGGSRKLR